MRRCGSVASEAGSGAGALSWMSTATRWLVTWPRPSSTIAIARVAPNTDTAMRVVIGRAARAARSGRRDPSASRATTSA